MGYAPRGKGLESKEQYYNRMGGLLTLYAAVLQAALLLWLTRGTRVCEWGVLRAALLLWLTRGTRECEWGVLRAALLLCALLLLHAVVK